LTWRNDQLEPIRARWKRSKRFNRVTLLAKRVLRSSRRLDDPYPPFVLG